MKKLFEIFSVFARISTFVIGGGYAIIAVADELCAKRGWTKEGEVLDNLPVFQMIPGLIATHTAVYVGNKVAGPLGAVTALVAVALPAVVCFLFICVGYANLNLEHPLMQGAFTGLRAALTGIIAATAVRSWVRNLKDTFSYSVMVLAALAIGVVHFNIALVLLVAMIAGIASVSVRGCGTIAGVDLMPFLLFLKYGSLAFGGGFVIVPMYLEDFVGSAAPYLQISVEEFSNIMALSQMTPGPIGVNAVTFFGYRLAGVPGSLAASVLLLLPGSLLVFAVVRSLDRFKENFVVKGVMRGVRPASVALMVIALVAFARFSCCDCVGAVMSLAVGALVYFKKLGIIRLIFISGVLGIAFRYI